MRATGSFSTRPVSLLVPSMDQHAAPDPVLVDLSLVSFVNPRRRRRPRGGGASGTAVTPRAAASRRAPRRLKQRRRGDLDSLGAVLGR